MTNRELFELISKQWANVNDIQLIASCGKEKASLIRDTIKQNIINSNLNLPRAKYIIVPMQNVVEYLNIDIDHITEMAIKENLIHYRKN